MSLFYYIRLFGIFLAFIFALVCFSYVQSYFEYEGRKEKLEAIHKDLEHEMEEVEKFTSQIIPYANRFADGYNYYQSFCWHKLKDMRTASNFQERRKHYNELRERTEALFRRLETVYSLQDHDEFLMAVQSSRESFARFDADLKRLREENKKYAAFLLRPDVNYLWSQFFTPERPFTEEELGEKKIEKKEQTVPPEKVVPQKKRRGYKPKRQPEKPINRAFEEGFK